MDTMDDSGYDPTNWPLITYQLTLNSNDAVMCDVLCAVRAQPDTLDKMQMKCTLSSPAPVNMCSTPATLERQLSCETTNTTPANQNSDRSSTSYNNNKECFSGDSSNRDDPDFNPELDTGHDSSEDYDPDLDPGHQGGYPLQEGQYQLSNVVCLESKGKPLSFDAPVCIAIPYRMPSGGSLPRDQLLCVLTKEIPVNADVGNPAGKNRPKTARPRASRHTPRSSTSSTSSTRGKAEAEPDTTAANRDKDDEEGDSSDDSSETPEVEWNETTALDITFNEFPMTKFLEIRVRRLHRLLVVAILKQKTDLQWVTARGAKISSSVDSRVAVFVPRKAFKSPQQIHLKVRPVDGAVVNEMKTRYSNNYIISCSPIVTFRVDSGTLPNKPISVSIPCQQTASAQRSCQSRPKSSATVSTSSKTDKSASTSKRPSTAWAGNSKGEEPGEVAVEEDIQVLFQSAGQTTWCQRPASQIKEEMTRVVRDNVLVDIEIAEISIIILKTIGPYSLTELTKNVGQIERQLLENQICFVVRQRDDDTAAVHVECCHSTAVQRTMDNLSREGFTYGPGHSTKVYVEEGDQLMVTFRGNLTFDEEDRMMFTFHKYLKSCRRATYIKEVDRFAQHGFDVYRGHVQLYRVSASAETELLCELPVTLPKPLMEPTVVVRAPVVIADTGPLTKAYFSELSVFIGAEWQLLADKLGIKKARMQNLMRGRSSSRQASIEDMLAHWYKRCPKKMDKTTD